MTTNHVHPLASRTPISSIMSKHFPIVRDTVHLDGLARFLLEHKATWAAVSDQGGRLVGCISMIDLVRDRYLNGETEDDVAAKKEMRKDFAGELRTGFHLERTPRRTVKDIMMPYLIRLPESSCIDRAAAVMAFEGVPNLLVLSESGAAIGLVTAQDVLRWLGDREGHVTTESLKSQWRSSCEYVT